MGNDRLRIKLGNINLKNPFIAASGTIGYAQDLIEVFKLASFGAVILKGTTLKPRKGNPPPRVYETPCGLINSIGLENPGIECVVDEVLPELNPLRKSDTKIILNLAGESIDEYIEIVRVSSSANIDGIELNLSCPNIKGGGMIFGTDEDMVKDIVSGCRSEYNGLLIVKLPPMVSDITKLAMVCESSGADVVSPTNTIPAMCVDIYTQEPVLGNITGGLSGPAIKPVLLNQVYSVIKGVKIPVIGGGGVMSIKDTIEYFLIGAIGIQIGTGVMIKVDIIEKLIKGLLEYLNDRDYNNIYDIIGVI